MQAMAQGLACSEIARALSISAFTVRKHRSNMLAKLGLHNAPQLLAHARGQGWLTPSPGPPGSRAFAARARGGGPGDQGTHQQTDRARDVHQRPDRSQTSRERPSQAGPEQHGTDGGARASRRIAGRVMHWSLGLRHREYWLAQVARRRLAAGFAQGGSGHAQTMTRFQSRPPMRSRRGGHPHAVQAWPQVAKEQS